MREIFIRNSIASFTQGLSFTSSDGIGTIIFNVLFVFVEVLVLVLKFWAKTIEATINLFTAEARDVSNDIVLITGAGHGMGKELSMQYSKLGATVVCWDINEELNLGTVKLIRSSGGKAFGYT